MKGKESRQEREIIMVKGVRRVVPPEVTFRDFSALAKRRNWTAEFLSENFKGKIENPSELFHRILSCKYHGEDRGYLIIPYKSILDFYWRELSPLIEEKSIRFCICGCQRRVHGRKSYASMACRKRMERRRSETPKRGSEKPNKDGAFSVTF
ncbi:MAG: hypothetical protein V3W19_08770 [Desulfatiglandales bacterium]